MAQADELAVEVAYALPREQVLLALTVEPGTTVQQAIERSGLLDRFPDIDLAAAQVGIFGKLSRLDTVLRAGDRVEVYRPLIADPKEVRRKRAAAGKVMRKGAGAEEDGGE